MSASPKRPFSLRADGFHGLPGIRALHATDVPSFRPARHRTHAGRFIH
ncbi:hypothetical protein SXCC_02128 [Gluconacetobacter sp. SXCC-1]|nr:hypothetical protein SXCC_02128 [Gluconacetobacter sp. SXCC-1]